MLTTFRTRSCPDVRGNAVAAYLYDRPPRRIGPPIASRAYHPCGGVGAFLRSPAKLFERPVASRAGAEPLEPALHLGQRRRPCSSSCRSRPPRSAPPARAATAGPRACRSAGSAPSSRASSSAAARLSPSATTRLTSPIASASAAPTGRPVRIMSIARLDPDQPRQPHRPAVDQRHAPAPAEHPEHRALLGDPQVAPQRQLEPAGDGVTRDRRDHRL